MRTTLLLVAVLGFAYTTECILEIPWIWVVPNEVAGSDVVDLDREHTLFGLAPSSVPHLVIKPEEIGSKEVFVIGDVHGCYDELVEILEVSGVRNNSNAIVVFAGDLINKGPKSKEVINLIQEIGAYSVRGNHDHKCLIKRLQEQMDYDEPLEEKYEWLHDLGDHEIAFLSELPYTISIPSLNAVIVHAGLVPDRPLTQQDPWDMMMMRNLILQKPSSGGKIGYQTEKHYEPGKSWSEVWEGPEHVYYGHAASRGFNRQAYATGLDSGCVYGGSLTGMFLTGEQKLVQVKARRIYAVNT